MFGSVMLEPTWRSRFERRSPPTIVLDRYGGNFSASSAALPQPYQTGFPAEYFEYIPEPVGQYPLGPFLPRYSRALRAGIDGEDIAELDWAEPPAQAIPVLNIVDPPRHTNYNVDVADGEDEQLIPADRWCTYLLVVNNGANDALVGFGKPSEGGLLLASGGGFLELVSGTKAALYAQGNGGATTLTIVKGRADPARACRLPCEPVG